MTDTVEITKHQDVTTEVRVYSVVDQDGEELSVVAVQADRDGDLIVKVNVPYKEYAE